MRIDKYLKLTRLIKRRTVAKELTNRDLFYINGKIAKPSSNVKEGDILKLELGKHILEVKVLKIASFAKKEDAIKMYEIISDTVNENYIK